MISEISLKDERYNGYDIVNSDVANHFSYRNF